ncbi:MAG: tRNA-dihydrouridine synthase [Rhodobacteraceae bacterium]|nr:tRNA-dihydrouridine synthase [Paracoccaceae bacterium]
MRQRHAERAQDFAVRVRAADSGVQMVTIYGCTWYQFYRNHANRAATWRVKSAVGVPVTADGGTLNAAEARSADDVVIGHEAKGRPWVLAEVAYAFYGIPALSIPVGGALVDLVASHYRMMLDFYGPGLDVRAVCKRLVLHIGPVRSDTATLRRAVLTERGSGGPVRVTGCTDRTG